MEIVIHPNADTHVGEILAEMDLERFDRIVDVESRMTFTIAEVQKFHYCVQVQHGSTLAYRLVLRGYDPELTRAQMRHPVSR